jgi:hypothetical protein
MISPQQLRALQSLWAEHARRCAEGGEGIQPQEREQARILGVPSLPSADSRETRLQWAAQQLGRAVASFTELSGAEAGVLIDALKRELGQAVTPPRRKRMDREAAEHFALDGRKGYTPRVEQMATAEHLAEIARLRERLGWSAEEFEHWLRYSASSPVKGGKLLTVSAVNRVRWALKSMLRRKGLERVS